MDGTENLDELPLLQHIFDLRERAVESLLAERPADALMLAEEAIQQCSLLKKQDAVSPLLKEKFAQLLYRIGRELARVNRLGDAGRALKSVAEIERRVRNLPAAASLMSDLATMNFEAGLHRDAIEIYRDEVLPLRRQLKDAPGIRRTFRNMGLAYARLKEAENCFSCLLQSIESAEAPVGHDEIDAGLRTVLTIKEEGLVIPHSHLKAFHAMAQAQGLAELEQEFDRRAKPPAPVSLKRIRVFISYSHSDGAQVETIPQFLPTQLFDVYFDGQRLHPGWKWESKLLEMIRAADVFVLMLGADTMQREYVNKEIDVFQESHDSAERGIIPVLIDGCEIIPNKVAAFQALDLRGQGSQSRARSIASAIHGTFFIPTSEIAEEMSRTMRLREKQGVAKSNPPKWTKQDADDMRRKWESGEIGASPHVIAQMTNLGVTTSCIQCAHRELDMNSMQPKRCEAPAVVVCAACSTGACQESFHVFGRFCTVLPPGDMFSPGTKMFYWCTSCRGPVCARCLEIEDDYPCPADQVLSFRFLCPTCRGHVQIVPVLDADMEQIAAECMRWARAGGPPDVNRTR